MDILYFLDGKALEKIQWERKSSAAGVEVQDEQFSLKPFVREVYTICLDRDEGSELTPRHSRGRRLIESICRLFDLIDIDSTGVIHWVDFTDFIVHTRGAGYGARSGEGDLSVGTADRACDISRFAEKPGFTDRSSHCHEIRSMRYNEDARLLLVADGGPAVKIYRTGPQKVGDIEPAIAMREHLTNENYSRSGRTRTEGGKRAGGGTRGGTKVTTRGGQENTAVLAVEFIGHPNHAALSCADGNLTVWNLETYTMLRFAHARTVQEGLRFCPSMDVLVSWGGGELRHDILVWNAGTLSTLRVLSNEHFDTIKDVCEMAWTTSPKGADAATENSWEPMLATAAMDGKIVVWDLRLGAKDQLGAPRKLHALVGHSHGVRSLAYSIEHDVLISAGFEYDALCWERSTNRLRMKLEGHRRSLIGVAIVRQKTQLAVTGDEGGSFRLWDIGRECSGQGHCLQSFSLSSPHVSLRTMVVAWREELVVAGSKMHVFRLASTTKIANNPGQPLFSTYTGELCVLLADVVIIDARTGNIVRRTVQQPKGHHVTAFCTDTRHKKVFIGDQKGGLRVYDFVTGKWLMSASPHGSEVSALAAIDEDQTFVSASWDRCIRVHDARVRRPPSARQRDGETSAANASAPPGKDYAPCLRSVARAHDEDITLMAVSSPLGLLATASSDLTVRVWDYSLLQLEEVIVAHRHEITCIFFLDPTPCLATADAAGRVLIWDVRPHLESCQLLLAILNTFVDDAKNGPLDKEARIAGTDRSILPAPVTSMAFYASASPGFMADKNEGVNARNNAVKNSSTLRQGEPQQHSEIPEPSEARRVFLITGDEFGSIKMWDLTHVLRDERESITYSEGSCTLDGLAGGSLFGKTSTRRSVHHRDDPMNGVGSQAAVRFRKLMDIARIIRHGDYLPSTQAEADNGAGLLHGADLHRELTTPGNACPGASSGRHDSEVRLHPGRESLGDTYAEVSAALNPSVDAMGPVASWAAHTDSILSLQVIPDPPAILTGSTDGSARLYSLDGTQLGVVIDQNSAGKEPWRFCPPPAGRDLVAASRASSLADELERLAETVIPRGATASEASSNIRSSGQGPSRLIHRPLLPTEAPTTQEASTPCSGDTIGSYADRNGEAQRQIAPAGRPEHGPSTHGRIPGKDHGEIAGGDERRGLPAAYLSRIRESPSSQAPPSRESNKSNLDQLSPEDDIEGRLIQDARKNWEFSRSGTGESTLCSAARVSVPVRGSEHEVGGKQDKRGGTQEPSRQKIPANLAAEQERKKVKRTRSPLQFLASRVSRTGRVQEHRGGLGSVKFDQELDLSSLRLGDEVKAPLEAWGCASRKGTARGKAASRRKGQTQGQVQTNSAGESPDTVPKDPEGEVHTAKTAARPSGRSHALPLIPAKLGKPVVPAAARSLTLEDSDGDQVRIRGPLNVKGTSTGATAGTNIASRRMVSSSALRVPPSHEVPLCGEALKMAHIPHRRNVIEEIIESVRRIEEGKNQGDAAAAAVDAATPRLPGTRRGSRHDEIPEEAQDEASHEDPGIVCALKRNGNADKDQRSILSGRVTGLLRRFDMIVHENGGRTGETGKNKGRNTLSGRRGASRSATRRPSPRKSERCHRPQKSNLIAMKRSHQRRQEATVGLSGPNGGRFGPYVLEDVLEFQAFVRRLGSQGDSLLQNEGMMGQASSLDDPHLEEMRKELVRLGVLHRTQELSLDNLLKSVFCFAKREDLRRMVNAMNISALLERLRDACLMSKDSFLRDDGSLLAHMEADVESTFRVRAHLIGRACLVSGIASASQLDPSDVAACVDACGTCTVRELHGMMVRTGSELFTRELDEVEALAAQCGLDGHKELSAKDFMTLVTKLAKTQDQSPTTAGRCHEQPSTGNGSLRKGPTNLHIPRH